MSPELKDDFKDGLTCPACKRRLVLPEHLRDFEFIFASRVQCPECGAKLLISDNVPMLDETT